MRCFSAQAQAKELVDAVADRTVDEALIADLAGRIAVRRASAEAGEGLSAFLEKRAPAWVARP